MAGVSALISSLISSVTNLLPEVKNSFFAPSSSSSAQSPDARAVDDDLNKLMRTLKRIKATVHDAEKREIRDSYVKLWLKELKEMGHAAEYVIDEYMYEAYRAQVEARNASELNSHKSEQEEVSGVASCAQSIRVPDGFVDRIREIRGRFDEIAKDREALRLNEGDGLRRDEGARIRAPSSHLILESNVFGREMDKEMVIDLLFSNNNDGIIRVIPIVGKGGLGKTTLAQLVYNDIRVKQKFDLFGWTCFSEDFNVERITQNLIESFTRNSCHFNNLSALHGEVKEIVAGKRVFVVLDDVWNEDESLWELLLAPFMSAIRVAFIVTTRSDRVARIMQTTSPFRLDYLPEEESWSLFQYYAFRGIDHNMDVNLLDLGRRITKKCGGLPLAIKSISNLLRYENEESWVEILENDLWEIHAENDIFGALQISYTHMPTYLRPCFVFCSLFPKDYEYDVDEMIEFWIAEGYIESKGRRTLEEIAFEYATELRERSFVDPIYGGTAWNRFKIHDIVHDLARLSSGNELYSVERGKRPNPPDEVLHIYVDDCKELSSSLMKDHEGLLKNLNSNNVTRLRTLLVDTTSTFIDFSEAKSLRVLRLNYKSLHRYGIRYQPRIRSGYSIFSLYHLEKLTFNLVSNSLELKMLGNLINLKFLSLSGCNVETIPESLCSLSNLRSLSIKMSTPSILPENIGNLVCLEKLVIHNCEQLSFLPESLCKLSGLKTLSLTDCSKITKLPNDIGNLANLQSLIMNHTGLNCLPRSFSRLNVFSRLSIDISLRLGGLSDTITWLKDFNILRGALAILRLGCMPSLEDALNFNLISKPNLEKLVLSWGPFINLAEDNQLRIELGSNDNILDEIENVSELLGEHMRCQVFENTKYKDRDLQLQVLDSLQPHPNLKHLYIREYQNPIFPGWVGCPLSCASLEEIEITFCDNITYLPFGNLRSLKHLAIKNCHALPTISRDSLPWPLRSLDISFCSSLLSVTGLEDLELLDWLVIYHCERLKYFSFELISEERCHRSSSSGLKNVSPPKKVNLGGCPNLQLPENEVLPSLLCNIEIFDCIGLKEWCLQHNISYISYDFKLESFISW